MKNILGFILLIFVLLSCKDDTINQKRILIRNSTDHGLSVVLFPKAEYLDGDMYKYCSFCGGSRSTIFLLNIKSEEEIFVTDNLNVSPSELAKQVFDSIHVIVIGQNTSTIHFKPDTVVNYSVNLFSSESDWNYTLNKFNLLTNFSKTRVISNDFSFEILINN